MPPAPNGIAGSGTMTLSSGLFASTATAPFTYYAKPALAYLLPSSGRETGGITLRLSVSGFPETPFVTGVMVKTLNLEP